MVSLVHVLLHPLLTSFLCVQGRSSCRRIRELHLLQERLRQQATRDNSSAEKNFIEPEHDFKHTHLAANFKQRNGRFSRVNLIDAHAQYMSNKIQSEEQTKSAGIFFFFFFAVRTGFKKLNTTFSQQQGGRERHWTKTERVRWKEEFIWKVICRVTKIFAFPALPPWRRPHLAL